jgi:site-specific DNA-cytosine methylase
MKVLIACECSGVVREAFRVRGHDAWSCDILPTEMPGQHIQDDVLKHLDEGWDLMIAHPPCTHLAVSGARWFKEKKEDGRQQEGIDFFMNLVNAAIPHVCVENPVGIMSSFYRKPDQIIQPWMFGESFQKTTCLWLKNLPLLKPTKIVDKGEFITHKSGKKKPKWYADCAFLPKEERQRIRSKTYQGIAEAMAEQWTNIRQKTLTEVLGGS